MIERIKSLPRMILVQQAWGLLAGLLIGLLSWSADHPPVSAVMLPLIVGLAPNRIHAFLIAWGYSAGVTRANLDFSWTWSDGNALYTGLIWIGESLLGGLGWSLAWTASDQPWRKAAAQVLAWTVTLLPPLAILTNGHVLPAYGFILQGWHWAAVALSVGTPALFAYLGARDKIAAWKLRIAVSLAFVALWLLSFGMKPVETRFVEDLAAPSTSWGQAKGDQDILGRVSRIGDLTAKFAEAESKVVIWPASTLGTVSPELLDVLYDKVLKGARARAQTVVLGADVKLEDGNFETAALVFYPDGRMATVLARQPIPFIQWRPWKSKDSYRPDWTTDPVLSLGDGRRARMVFCFEEYLPVLALIDEATRDFNLTVVMSHNWAVNSATATAIQRNHSLGMALMFGRKYLRSANSARQSSPDQKT